MNSICEQAIGLGDERYWRGFAGKINRQRIPLSGSLALTHRCNLACVHCYIKEKPGISPLVPELSTGQWLSILGDIKNAGCLNLLLTGGEPLLREDFSELYTFAKTNGFLVTVFTNGTLISERIVELFRSLPPRLVEISLYGAEPETNDRITACPGSFDKALRGIRMLLSAGVPVRLKSILMTLNDDGFPFLEALARSLGLKFRFDPAIFPTQFGDRAPIDLRVSPERAVELEMADPDRMREWREFTASFRGLAKDEGLYNCGSGVSTFHVDAHGWLFPCQMVRVAKYQLAAGSFQEGWEQAFNDFRNRLADSAMPCRDCEDKLLCGYCPGFFEMENGSEHAPSDYTCAIGRGRSAKLNSPEIGG